MSKDAHHKKAFAKIKDFEKDRMYITQFTIPEAATVISHKISQFHAIRFLAQSRGSQFNLIQINEWLIEKTDEIFMRQKTKGTSWIDCLNVAAIHVNSLDGILSFDNFYKKMGIKVF